MVSAIKQKRVVTRVSSQVSKSRSKNVKSKKTLLSSNASSKRAKRSVHKKFTSKSSQLKSSKLKVISSAKITGKRVLLCCDFNVPLKDGKIQNDYRILQSLPTIKYILSQKPKQLVLISHLGRPKGVDLAFSLKPVALDLSKKLKVKVSLSPTLIYSEFSSLAVSKSPVVLLENLRFSDGEQDNDLKFAKNLSEFADIYVNDGFGTAHRKQASNFGVTKYLPSYAGLLLANEVKYLDMALKPKRPFVCVVGFSKIADKLTLVEKLLKKSDYVLVGGAVCFTFFRALGLETGKSLVEVDQIQTAKRLLATYERKIILPLDIVCAKNVTSKPKTYAFTHIPKSEAGFDVGPETVALFSRYIAKAQTVFWNGPLGLFEQKPFDAATVSFASQLVKSKCITIIGGGDTASAILSTKYAKDITHISTGGGASLAFIEKGNLPAIKPLRG
jgi:phosphoglycerate kinase